MSKRNVVGIALSCCMAVLIFCVSSVPGNDLPPKLGFWSTVAHFCEYTLLAVFLSLAVYNDKRDLWKLLLIVVVIGSAYGASDEFHQLFVFGRNSDVLDWVTDTLGSLFGGFICLKAQRCKAVRENHGKES
ncbi:MAG: VanZ family protein [Coriobacteriales bacterium]